MARLPRRSSVSPVGTRVPDPDLPAIERDPVPTRASLRAGDGLSVGERGARGTRSGGQPVEDGVELDAAIESMLAAGGVDAVTRIRLSEARRAINEGAREGESEGFEGASLSRALFRFVMPRLHHPEVLRADRHRTLLEGLAEGLATQDEDGVVRESALVVHRELRRLALLRAGRNALVEG